RLGENGNQARNEGDRADNRPSGAQSTDKHEYEETWTAQKLRERSTRRPYEPDDEPRWARDRDRGPARDRDDRDRGGRDRGDFDRGDFDRGDLERGDGQWDGGERWRPVSAAPVSPPPRRGRSHR